MPVVQKEYKEIVSDVINHLTKGISKDKHTYNKGQSEYELHGLPDNSHVLEILNVFGFYKGVEYTFDKDSYALKGNKIEWRSDNSNPVPDDVSDFIVTYRFDHLPIITDTTVGSVSRTLIEAISREFELLYREINYIYESGFIDTAKGSSLDFVVSILGIKRKPPTFANGVVTFFRDTDPPEITISETILYDGRDTYELKNSPVKDITKVIGFLEGQQQTFEESDYILEDNVIRLLTKLDEQSEFTVEYVAFQKVVVPEGTIVSTFSKKSENVLSFKTTRESLLNINNNRWESNVEVVATTSGSNGNVLPGSIIIMPRPPIGIDKVINRSAMAGGSDFEPDEALRDRAKRVLEVKGKATIESLRTALEGVDGIQSAPLIIDMPDDVPGIVKVIVDGGDEEEIRKVIDDTRAAGIVVEFERPTIVTLDISFNLEVKPKTLNSNTIINTAESNVREHISNLKIGDSVIVNQIVSVLMDIPEVNDVTDMRIETHRAVAKPDTHRSIPSSMPSMMGKDKVEIQTTDLNSNDRVMINPNERVYVRDINIKTKEPK